MGHEIQHGHQHRDDHEHHHGHAHSHETAHDHGHAHGEGAVHAIWDYFAGHSHDAADFVDDALEADARGRRALWISLWGLLATTAAQAVVVLWSHSVALLGDTLHNAADAATAIPLLIAFALARRGSTTRLTYGYGRAEDLAGVFVLMAITASTIAGAWTSIDRLFSPRPVQHLPAVAVAAVIGFLGNEGVAYYRIRVGKQIGSAALVADGLHARADGFTSLAVLLGAAGVALGWRQADAVVGIVITLVILNVLRSATKQVGARLMDAVDPALVTSAHQAIGSVEGIRGIEDLKLRWIGHELRAEADVLADADLTLSQAHDLAHHAEDHLIEYVPGLRAATIHVSPTPN